jgi:hypothetical protein
VRKVIGGREGSISTPGVLVSKGLFELPEYPYLRKYPTRKRQFSRSDERFLALFSIHCNSLQIETVLASAELAKSAILQGFRILVHPKESMSLRWFERRAGHDVVAKFSALQRFVSQSAKCCHPAVYPTKMCNGITANTRSVPPHVTG